MYRMPLRPALLALLVFGCAPRNLPMELAEAQCVQYALGGGGGLTVGVSTGAASFGNDGWGGLGVAVATEIPSGRSPAAVYNACVLRRTGQPPLTPFADRPELQG
jgi:hypothetical protein